ncbi:hypothetical protein [Rahnella sp. PCH160]
MSIIGQVKLNGRHSIFISQMGFTHKMRNKNPAKTNPANALIQQRF